MLDMHPQTLRKYERLGLVRPARTVGSMRLYSHDEIERLRFIKRLVDESGVNLAGVQQLLSVAEAMQRIRPLMQPAALAARRDAAAVDARNGSVGGAARASITESDEARRGLQGLLHHARRLEDRHRQGDQAGVPQARPQVSPRRQSGRQGGRGQVQGSQRGQRGAERSGEAEEVRRARRQLARLRERAAGRESVRRRRAVRRRSGARGGAAAASAR